MSGPYSTKSCLVYDLGLFVETAVRLTRDFGKVYYYCPGEEATTPTSNQTMIGTGIPNVQKVNKRTFIRRGGKYTSLIDEIDLFVFPDVSSGETQEDLVDRGKRVWGSRFGEELELDRVASKKLLAKLGFSIGPYAVVHGIPELREYVKKHPRVWVKVSRYRGDCESFFAKNYKHAQPKIDQMEHDLGPVRARKQEFIVEDDIPDAVEVGYDGYCVDAVFPKAAVCGIEVKDQGYVGVFRKATAMPKQIQDMNARIADTLKTWEYRNFFAMEARITKDGTPWVIDPCCRQGSPPSELLLEMYVNLADIFWHGADGKCIDPIPKAKWGAELIIESPWAEKNWQAIQFPAKVRDQVKIRNLVMDNGEYYSVPQFVGSQGIGSVVGWGATLEDAIAHCREAADQVDGYFLNVHSASLDEASGEIEKLKGFGITL